MLAPNNPTVSQAPRPFSNFAQPPQDHRETGEEATNAGEMTHGPVSYTHLTLPTSDLV